MSGTQTKTFIGIRHVDTKNFWGSCPVCKGSETFGWFSREHAERFLLATEAARRIAYLYDFHKIPLTNMEIVEVTTEIQITTTERVL